MKKRIAALILVLAALLTLGACQKGPKEQGEAFNPETDYAHLDEAGYFGSYVAEAPAGYYFISGYYLYYADKETMEAIPLCNKPDCKHHEETGDSKVYECNAFLGPRGLVPFVQYYEGALYAVEGVNVAEKKLEKNLVRLSMDGTTRQRIKTISDSELLAIHRGYLYECQNGTITRVPMSNLKGEPEVLFRTEMDEYNLSFQPKGNYLLIHNEGNLVKDKTYHDLEYVYDLKTGSLTQIAPDCEALDATASPYKCNDDRLLYAKMPNVETPEDSFAEGNLIYTCDMDGQNERACLDLRQEAESYVAQLSFDGTYYFEEWINYMNTDEEAQAKRKFRVYDKDFNLLYDGTSDWLPWVYWVSYGYGDYLFYRYSDRETGEDVIDCVDKTALAQGQLQVKRLIDHAATPVFGW